MCKGYLTAFVSAALASVKYRSYLKIYEQAIYVGPFTEMPDGSLVRSGNEQWSNSTVEARVALAKTLAEEGFSRFVPNHPRVSKSFQPVVMGEASSDIASRVAYAEARDSLIAALQHLAEICLEEGRDPRTSKLYDTLELRHELLDLCALNAAPSDVCEAAGPITDPIGLIRSLYMAGSRFNHG